MKISVKMALIELAIVAVAILIGVGTALMLSELL